MKHLVILLLLPLGIWAQGPSCTQKGTLTTATVFTALPNNTANPNCNAFALTWNSTGFSAISIQLQGSDDNVTYTAFTGSTTVLVGSNPAASLSGAIVIQASTKLAYLQVKLNSVSGTGGVNFQLYGYNGVTPAAKTGGGAASSVSWANVTAGTNTRGFLQVGSPTVIEPTPMSPGGIYATQVVDGNDLTAISVSTPAGPAVDFFNFLGSISSGGPTITESASGADSLINMLIQAKGGGLLYLGSTSASMDNAGNLIVAGCTGCASAAPVTSVFTRTGAVVANTGDYTAAQVTNAVSTIAANTGSAAFTLDASASTVANAVKVPVGAGQTATVNGAISYDSTNNNYHAAQNGADAKLASYTATPGNGNCANWSVSGGLIKLGDAGAACGSSSGGGGGVVTYSGPALSVLTGTTFCPIGGGGSCSTTETNVDIDSSAAATVSNMYVQLSQALGLGNSVVVTWRDNATSKAVTCTISGASATSCNDTTHSFNVANGDLLDYQLVYTGTIVVTPTILIMSAFGTSNVGVTSVFGNVGPTVGATGDILSTGNVGGVNGVKLCTGFTPTNGQNLQYTTASSPNPCYTAASPSGGLSPSGTYYLLNSGAYYGPVYPITPPNAISFTAENMGSATFTAVGNAWRLDGTADSSNSLHIQYIAAPSTPWSIAITFLPSFLMVPTSSSLSHVGLEVEDSGSGKIITCSYSSDNAGPGIGFETLTWPSSTSNATARFGASGFYASSPVVMKIVDDGTNIKCSKSYDGGQSFGTPFYSASETSFLPTKPNRVGIFVDTAASSPPGLLLLGWVQGTS